MDNLIIGIKLYHKMVKVSTSPFIFEVNDRSNVHCRQEDTIVVLLLDSGLQHKFTYILHRFDFK